VTEVRVEAGAALLRKVHPRQVVPDNEGGWRVASGTFRGDELRPGVKGFSVYVQARLASAGVGDEEILEPNEADKSIAWLPVDLIRELELDAIYRPEGPEPIRNAHAEVEGQLSKSRYTRLAAEASKRWIVLRPSAEEAG
jgi:hypothetical protein